MRTLQHALVVVCPIILSLRIHAEAVKVSTRENRSIITTDMNENRSECVTSILRRLLSCLHAICMYPALLLCCSQTNTHSSSDDNICASFTAAYFGHQPHRTMRPAHSSCPSSIIASFNAASFALCPMITHTPPWTTLFLCSFAITSFDHLCPMPNTHSSM